MKHLRAATACVCASALLLTTPRDAGAAPPLVVLHSFAAPPDGALPSAALMLAADGNFYGTTQYGGEFNGGTIFQMTPAGVVTVMHSFAGGAGDGLRPAAALIQASDGNFYGTTYLGGGKNFGTAFRMAPDGVVTVIHEFLVAADGAHPRAALLQASDGNLYGTTEQGGVNARGTVFGMTPAGEVFFRHVFPGSDIEGASPFAPLIEAQDGMLYGTLAGGGPSGGGVVFRVAGGTVSIVHAFGFGGDGERPLAPLIQGSDGNFYGTTSNGGTERGGNIFRMTPDGAVTSLATFRGFFNNSNQRGPLEAALIQLADGNFYGVTSGGHNSGFFGTVFRMTPSGVVTLLHTFSNGGDGSIPEASLIAVGGKLYGTAQYGGDGGQGVVFRLDIDINAAAAGDFDADQKADISVYRPSDGTWFVRSSSSGAGAAVSWGLSDDVPVPGDYDGDGRTDVAIYRPSNGLWFILKSTSGYTAFDTFAWGEPGDLPVPADYDGDGKADVAVYRPSSGVWYLLRSLTRTGLLSFFGAPGDIPAPGDVDGDGKADLALFRPSTGAWFVFPSSGVTYFGFGVGAPGDVAVVGDFDGDGRIDPATYRPSTGEWSILNLRTRTGTVFTWGFAGDVPVPSDYDGDGTTDIAVYRPSTGAWFILKSSTNSTTYDAFQWGAAGDVPILRR